MKTRTILLLALLMPFIFTSCQKINGNGDVVTVNRTVTDYSSIELSMEGDVYFSTAADYTLSIQAEENICNQIQTYTSGSKLIIKVKDGIVLGDHEPIKITVSAPSVSKFNISGSGSIHVTNRPTGSPVEATISGSGNIFINEVVADMFKGTISGSGNIEVYGGIVNQEELKISGSGNIKMQQVVADSVEATISGSGSIYTHAVKLLEATISGSGNIYYYGTPVINTHISGSGDIEGL
jgi:hypothetical protein